MKTKIAIGAINVLLYEPNPIDSNLIMQTLEENKLALNIIKTTNFVETLECLYKIDIYEESPNFDLILLDFNVIRKDGIEIMKILKEDERLKDIPVVIITLTMDEAAMLEQYNFPAVCYITKPIDLGQFEAVVHSVTNFWFTVIKPPLNGNDDEKDQF